MSQHVHSKTGNTHSELNTCDILDMHDEHIPETGG